MRQQSHPIQGFKKPTTAGKEGLHPKKKLKNTISKLKVRHRKSDNLDESNPLLIEEGMFDRERELMEGDLEGGPDTSEKNSLRRQDLSQEFYKEYVHLLDSIKKHSQEEKKEKKKKHSKSSSKSGGGHSSGPKQT